MKTRPKDANDNLLDLPSSKVRDIYQNKILDTIPSLVSYMDCDLNYQYVNKAYEKWFGVTQEQCLKSNMVEIVGKVAVDTVRKYLDAALGGVEQFFEAEVPYQSGGIKYIQVNYIPDQASDGSVKGITALINDVTAIMEQQKQLSLIFENMSDGFLVQNSEGEVVKSNSAALSLLNQTKDQLLKNTKNVLDFKAVREDTTVLLPSDYPAAKALRTGKNIGNFLMGVTDISGKIRWLQSSAIIFNYRLSITRDGKSGIEKRVLSTFTDVTHLRLAAIELVENQNQLHTFINGLPAHVSYWGKDCKNIYANELYYKYFGKTVDQMKGILLKDMLGPVQFEARKYVLEKVLKGYTENFEAEIILPDGSKTYSQVQYKPNFKDGKPDGFFVIAYDISLQKSIESKLVEKQVQLQKLIDGMPAFISHWNTDLLCLNANSYYTETFGITPEEMRGMHYQDVLGTFYVNVKNQVEQVLAGNAVSFETMKNAKDGTPHYFRVRFTPEIKDGKVVGFFTISVDETEVKKLQNQIEQERLKNIHQSKLASLGEMSAGIAHEINNPLAIITGSVGLLSKFANDPVKLAIKIASIQKSCDRNFFGMLTSGPDLLRC